MTQPDPSGLNALVAGNGNLWAHPELATGLLNSGATPAQAQTVNAFSDALAANARVQQARAGGYKITLTDQEAAGLSALGVNYGDVELTSADLAAQLSAYADNQNQQIAANQAQPQQQSGGGWFGTGWTPGRVFHDITHNPVTNAIDDVGKGIRTFANWFPTLLGYAGRKAVGPPAANTPAAASDQAMRDQGYDPNNLFSQLAYQYSGKNIFDANDLYKNNSEADVKAALAYTDDPTAYEQQILNLTDPTARAAGIAQLQSKQFQDLVLQVNARKPTAGNLVASFLDPVKDAKAHAIVATGTDIAFSLFADPTLVGLNAVKALKATQVALDTAGDANRIRSILTGETGGIWAAQRRNAVQSLVDNVKAYSEATDDAGRAAAYAKARRETPDLMHLWGDFTGGLKAHPELPIPQQFVAGKPYMTAGAPITEMGGDNGAIEYLASKVGTVRLFAGKPMAEIGLMPGALSPFGVRKLRGALAAMRAPGGVVRTAKRTSIDLTQSGVAERMLAEPGNSADVATGAGAELDTATGLPSAVRAATEARGDQLFDSTTGASFITRWRRTVQRMGSYLPRDYVFDTADPNSVEQVRRYARMYLTPSDADLTAAAYGAGDEGVRKSILTAMQLQTLHAAGLGTTQTGRDIIDAASRALTSERYGITNSEIYDPNLQGTRHAALWPSQVNSKLTLKSFADIQKYAAKVGIWENTAGRVLNAKIVDNVLKAVRGGWLITGSNVVRNAGEDLAGAVLRGEGKDVSLAKVVADQTGQLPQRTQLGRVIATVLRPVGRMYRNVVLRNGDERLAGYIADLQDQLTPMADYIGQEARAMVDPGGAREIETIQRDGLRAQRLRFQRTGFTDEAATTGNFGARRYAYHLGMIVNGNLNLTSAIIDHLRGYTQAAVSRLGSDSGSTFDQVVNVLRSDPRVQKMIRAGLFEDADGVTRKASTAAEKDLALQQLAHAQISELKYLLQKPNGQLNETLMDRIYHDGAPTEDWIDENIPEGQRPAAVIAPTYVAMPPEPGMQGLAASLAQTSGKLYQHLVERPIARMSSMPIFFANYGKARIFLEDWERQLVDGGMTHEAANEVAKNIGMDMAFNRTMKYIDDPGLRTQMDVVGRNFFAFSRATTAFIRRWGTQFVEDPARARKLMLASDAASNSGFTYTDANGDRQFMFPGSGQLINALQTLGDTLHWPGGISRIPGLIPGLTSQVQLLNPGLQNPIQYSLTPMVNIPMRTIFNLFPQHKETLDGIDAFFNGTQGQGASPLAEIEPTMLKKFTDYLNPDTKDSLTAGAVRDAIANLEAAGQLPPANATPAQLQLFQTQLQAQVKNQMLFRAIFGWFSPAAPGTPTEDTAGSSSDWFYGSRGIHNLSDEYKTILNDVKGDTGLAGQIWAQLHPDKLAYTTPTTVNMEKGSVVGDTAAALQWMTANQGFMSQYQGVSGYFVPVATQNGTFDLAAYHAELELGLRQHKDLQTYFNDVVAANSAQQYFQTLASRDLALKQDPGSQALIMRQWTAWKKTFDAQNPVFAANQSDSVQAAQTALGQLSTLRSMVANAGNLPSDVPIGAVDLMIQTYDNYHAAVENYPRQTNADLAMKAELAAQYSDWMHQMVGSDPQLQGLYTGVFQPLDSSVLDPLGVNS